MNKVLQFNVEVFPSAPLHRVSGVESRGWCQVQMTIHANPPECCLRTAKNACTKRLQRIETKPQQRRNNNTEGMNRLTDEEDAFLPQMVAIMAPVTITWSEKIVARLVSTVLYPQSNGRQIIGLAHGVLTSQNNSTMKDAAPSEGSG